MGISGFSQIAAEDNLVLIETKTLAAGTTATWTGLGGYDYYVLKLGGNVATSGNYFLLIRLNGDSGNNYSFMRYQGTTLSIQNTSSFYVGGAACSVGCELVIPSVRANGNLMVQGSVTGSDVTQYCLAVPLKYVAAADLTEISVLLDAGGGSGEASLYGVKN